MRELRVLHEPNTISEALNSYFISVVKSLESKLPQIPFCDRKPLHYSRSSFKLQRLNVDFVYNKLQLIKRNKATGLDNISARLIKLSARVIAPSVTNLLNM